MKVIQIVHSYHPFIGGVETHVNRVSEELTKKGVLVEIHTTDPTGHLRPEETLGSITVRRFRSWAPNGCYYIPFPSMWVDFRKMHADIIHVHCILGLHALFALFFLAAGERICLTPHYSGRGGSLLRDCLWRIYKQVLKVLIRRVNLVTCVSDYEKELMRRQFNIPSQKLIVIPNGVDVEELMNAKGRILRQSGLLKKEVLTMLYVGRVDRRKNVQEIIGAMALLRERLNKDFRLVIVAASEGRKRLARLQEIAKQKSVDQLIEWKQNVPRDLLLEEYARASLFVFPSEIEAFGLAVREAIAMGVPAIVANAGALRDLTKAGLAIGIDLPITSEKIVDCIIRVVQETQLCRKTVTFKTWNQVAEMLVGVYRTKLVRCEGPSTSASV